MREIWRQSNNLCVYESVVWLWYKKRNLSISVVRERKKERETGRWELFLFSVISSACTHTHTHTHANTCAHTHATCNDAWNTSALTCSYVIRGIDVFRQTRVNTHTQTHTHTHTHTHTPFPPFFKSPSIDFTLKFYCFCILLSQEITQNVKCSALSERLCLFCPEYLFKYQVVFNI